LDLEEQERSSFRYSYSVYQMEYSRNLCFKRGSDLDAIYQRLVDLSRHSIQIEKVKTIFGTQRRRFRRRHKTKNLEVTSAQIGVEKHAYDLTVFRVQYGKLAVRIYDKGERLLRIEAVAHNTRYLKCGKVIANLPKLIVALRDVVLRFLNVLSWAHTGFLDRGALDELPQASQYGNRRVAGIDVNQRRARYVIQAVMALAPRNKGFSTSDLACQVRKLTGLVTADYGSRQAAYDLLKLRAKAIVSKIGKTRRYIVEQAQLKSIATLVVLQDKIIKPLFQAMQPADTPADDPMQSQIQNQLDHHYQNLRQELIATLNTIGIAIA
jgi:hypothetical protein